VEAAINSKRRLILLAGWLSIVGNIILFLLKLWVGVITGSVALIADAWHTLADSLGSVIVVLSGWVGAKPADDEHPFGHGRADLISSVVIGVLLALIGLEFVFKGVEQLRAGAAVTYGWLAVAVTVLSIVVKEGMAQYAFWAGRRARSPVLKADGWHHRTDALSSLVVLAGILVGSWFWWIDGVLAILVAVMIFYASYEILRDSINRLIGETPDESMLMDIEAAIEGLHLGVVPHHYHLHRYGDHLELTFHVTMTPTLTLREAHQQACQIEELLRRRFAIEATVHMEPEGETKCGR
jgi:cation diffusion facilitator family transporter